MASLMDKFKKEEDKKDDVKSESNVKAVKETKDVKKEVKKETKKSATTSVNADKAYQVLVKPLVSEKGAIQQADSKYFFEVAKDSNKIEIKKAVESIYKVTVTDVNIINQRGKAVRFGRNAGFRKNWKKAIVTLKKGDRITTIESV